MPGCIQKIYSVSALIGPNTCNAKCKFCAATELRKEAKDWNSPDYWRNFEAAIKLSARYGGWSLSLTSSGELTCRPEAVSIALEHYQKCVKDGAYFPNINLFSNGILLSDKVFCKQWLPLWKNLGLTNIAVSIHSVSHTEQARAYGLDYYPSFRNIFDNIREEGIGLRVTLLLKRDDIDCDDMYQQAIKTLIEQYRINNITSWAIGNRNGSENEFTPSKEGLKSIQNWLDSNCILCHSHEWGGGVYDYNGNILRLTPYVTKHDPNLDFVRQLVVFQDATVAYSWIREGALCMK